ncbi:hypothetical protein MEO42_13480 [Dolichospermum sp. ST_sed6]|nr:hypothetical protein [Dolichospermum sp. ST_sed6]MDD1436794.1 hypothetical protein [Dolichospermum sp. ST_sed10]MDD1448484.1 hypothetical protein [Dolichospermum sp. ST_sed8]MDD1461748.1 hypothetical protein [Dolichospermum sp. ST_sed2]MDD1464029.1 hypothetical protein [Dolichospermum sp. ST_sed5]MDD1472545.1 hypothetical protein [Dolichospermum sp. ST_sed4]
MCLRYVESELSYSILSNSDRTSKIILQAITLPNSSYKRSHSQNHPTSDRTPKISLSQQHSILSYFSSVSR